MILKPFTSSFFVLCSALLIIACKKEGQPNEPIKQFDTKVNVSYFAKASGTGIKTTSVKTFGDSSFMPALVTWNSASIYIEKISFTGKNQRLIDTTILVGKKVDLFSTEALAGTIKLPVGTYQDVKVKMFLRKSPSSDFTFDLRGTFQGTKGFPYNLRMGNSDPFELNLTVNNISMESSDDYSVTFKFELDKILKGITLGMLESGNRYSTDPNTIVIHASGSSQTALFKEVSANWQTIASVTMAR